jgi:hypothetical protein
MAPATYLGVVWNFIVYCYTHELTGVAWVKGLLKEAGLCRNRLECGAIAYQPQNELNRLRYDLETPQPGSQIPSALVNGLLQPEVVGGQIKIAGASGNRGALLNTAQKFVLSEI